MRNTIVVVLILFAVFSSAMAQNPKHEFRAAWLSTVANIDWPSSPGSSPEVQKKQLIDILDYLKAANLNAVIFQVRPACDAMYVSDIEPWSYWLTGRQGKAPPTFFDPLAFAIEEAHKRGMELHAWFNPYRVKWNTWTISLADNNPAVQNPDWVLNIDDNLMLDPGLPQVREHVKNVIMDVVSRYDVDGIHFDDYFYVSGISDQDDETFEDYGRGFTDRGDWRRDNVNELLRMVYDGIQDIKPHVKFGQSPAGIWKSGVPSGIFGQSNYSVIYCDAVSWLDEQIIDYLTPQLYWPFGGGQDYGKLMPWWVSVRNDRHIYPGLAYYRVGNSGFDESEIGRMIRLNRNTEGAYGEVYFTSNDFAENRGGVTDTLKQNYYRYKAIVPPMDWKDNTVPGEPGYLRFDRVAGLGTTGITWDAPADDDVARYVLYKFDTPEIDDNLLANPGNIYDVTSNNYFIIDDSFPAENNYYVVTALDHNNNESIMSNIFEFMPSLAAPSQPLPVFPLTGSDGLTDTVIVAWQYAQNASTYNLQVSTDPGFNELFIEQSGIVDTNFVITGQAGETTYFWRVKSVNMIGESEYSETYSFTTGFPAAPALITPAFQQLDVELEPDFKWQSREDAIDYRFQLYDGLSVISNALMADTLLAEAEFTFSGLMPSSFYSWRVKVANASGTSLWSDIYQFKTLSVLPDVPQIVSPADGIDDVPDSVALNWTSSAYSVEYRLQIAYDESFTQLLYDEFVADTNIVISDLLGETKYYWKVSAKNNSGASSYTDVHSFTTGFPAVPEPLYPLDTALDIPLSPVIRWAGSAIADSYVFQMSEDVTFNINKVVVDTTVIDSSFQSAELKLGTIYTWRVKASNNVGESYWTEGIRFKTVTDTATSVDENSIPVEYALYQNYPNPFNPATNIQFDLPERSFVSLAVYNVIGQEIARLVNNELPAGKYNLEFNSAGGSGSLPSGLYIYVLRTDKKSFVQKMMLIK